jgi:hypothetical protein
MTWQVGVTARKTTKKGSTFDHTDRFVVRDKLVKASCRHYCSSRDDGVRRRALHRALPLALYHDLISLLHRRSLYTMIL